MASKRKARPTCDTAQPPIKQARAPQTHDKDSTVPLSTTLKLASTSSPAPVPPAALTPAAIGPCPHVAHCPQCPGLPQPPYFTNAEFILAGCCGRSGVNGTACAAWPVVAAASLLTPIMLDPANIGATQDATRWRMYTKWYAVCAAQGWVHDHPTAVTAAGEERLRYSGCVLARIRNTHPNLPGIPYVSAVQ